MCSCLKSCLFHFSSCFWWVLNLNLDVLLLIFQNLSEIPSLHGLEDDEALADEMNTRALGFKAFR